MTRKGTLLAGAVLVIVAALLPNLLPHNAAAMPSARLLSLGFAVEGLVLLLIGLMGVRWPSAGSRREEVRVDAYCRHVERLLAAKGRL